MNVVMHRIQCMSEWKALRQQWRSQRIAFVPTMGNLHAGHLSLVKRAKECADKVVVSIYVNPMQFAPTEDFASYPRTAHADCEQLQALGVDCVLLPTESWLYPAGVRETTFVDTPQLGQILCGTSRPTFFKGVATVVLKLFNLVKPDIAIFGEKDYQQSLVIKKMVSDLLLDIDIVTMPIFRESDGLAMSSRNQYLNPDERKTASLLYQVISELSQQIQNQKQANNGLLINLAKQKLTRLGFEVDYLALRKQADLTAPSAADQALILLVAAVLGKTRLIDNVCFKRELEKRAGVETHDNFEQITAIHAD